MNLYETVEQKALKKQLKKTQQMSASELYRACMRMADDELTFNRKALDMYRDENCKN
jgi:hypothetical protein